jgi:glutaredoxin-like YruB-family protein
MVDKQVIIYSLSTWPDCKKAKEYLSQKGISYIDYDVAIDKERTKEMMQKSGQLGVPVILVNDDVLIGFKQAKLDKLLSK